MAGAPSSGGSVAARALAAADFSALGARFQAAGLKVALPAPGMLHITRGLDARCASVLLSVGVHGDETAPIELLAPLLDALARQPDALAVDLMLCVGNPEAIRAGRRFIDADLNRMFRAGRGALAGAVEAARADAIQAATARFFAAAGPLRWHLDLHAAIRPSLYPRFAIVPELIAPEPKAALFDWLAAAAIGAIIVNPRSAGTYSYYTAEHCGAAAATLELGQVGALGQNDASLFAAVGPALDGLLRGAAPETGAPCGAPQVFRVVREIIKTSDAFRFAFGRDMQNFSALPAGAVIATDGGTVHTVQYAEERVVFPNPDVRVGLRAALMVVRQS